LVFDGRIYAEVGVVSDVLSFGRVAEEARQVAAERGKRGTIE
jgi:hypothetical protein